MKRVLIVDDKEENLYYLQVLLNGHGFVTELARHGAQALVMARRTRPDLVISDLLMPVMDGYTLLRHWKLDPALRQVPFVVYTATYTEPEDERLALDMGADAFILKPSEPEDFLAHVEAVLAAGAAVAAAAPDFKPEPGRDEFLMQGYSQTLIRKLEEKSIQLEEANRALHTELVELERAQAALRASEHELRALAEAMPQMVWMTRPDGANVYFNQRWVDYTGLSVEASCGDRWIEPFHPDDRAEAERAWKRSTQGQGDYSIECRLRRVDGAYRWMLIRGLPYRDEAGQIVKWMGTCTDIEDLKRSEEVARDNAREQRRLAHELEAERQRLLAAQEVSKVGSWETDLQTLEVTWSLETYRIFGSSPAEFQPSHEKFLAMVDPQDREMVDAALKGSVDDRLPGFIEHGITAIDGTAKRIEERWKIVESNGLLRAIGTCQDVTERQMLEARMRQGQRLESIGQLTGGVAHDFNNLLTVILGNAEILTERLAGDPRMAELAEMVVDAAERGAQLAQRLLAFGRKQALEPRSVNVNDLVAGMDALLRRTLGGHIEIEFRGAGDLWNALVDPAQLDNALLNLCLNARDAMPGGGRLAIETANADLRSPGAAQLTGVKPGQYVRLTVTDSGTGISAAHLGRVFEPFFTTKEVGKGTGLGLAMIYGFVKQSGGHITIDSRPGGGTAVRLYLPRTTSEPASAPRVQGSAPAPGPANGRGTILLVEDDSLVRRYANDQLTGLGYHVLEADSGAQALAFLSQSTPVDLLFTDVVMPGMSGSALAERACQLRPGLRVLYASGYTEDAIVHHGQLAQGAPLLAKPYRRDELAGKVLEALSRPG
ncbi:MAG: response regulator [Pseudomonadota bacterium]